VTLKGSVDSWAEKQLCVAVAKGVRGVRAVNDQMVVQYELDRPDAEIKAEIEARLANDVRVDDYGVEVVVNEGMVTLTGAVGSLTEKRQAEANAWVAGVDSVDVEGLDVQWWARDEMRRKSFYTPRSDEEIEEAVRDAFLYDPRVLSFEPAVHVSNGTVTLSGVVDNLAARRAAEEDARNVIGVWRVRNHLKVRPASLPSDEELEKRVSRAIREDEYVERWEIEVEADAGEIRLSGRVDNSFEKNRAEWLTERTKGVIHVVNNVEYDHQWVWKPDWELREDVKDQLFWSPFVDEGDVTVAVESGVVTLTGQVDTWPERAAAEDNAWEAGAKDVRNELSVRYTYFGPLAYDPVLHPVRKSASEPTRPSQ
jgi:osmotically-inducible protein OsmY